MHYFTLIFTVVGIGVGQLFFKSAAIEFENNDTLLSPKLVAILSAAIGIYGVSTVAWVYTLTKIQLSHAYPFMALTFFIIPLGSYWFFDESIEGRYFFGVALIVLGVFITVLSNK